MSEVERQIGKFLQDWKNNPLYWKNNKRKFHGYCVLRKPAKIPWLSYSKQPELFNVLSKFIEGLEREEIKEQIDKMASINNI